MVDIDKTDKAIKIRVQITAEKFVMNNRYIDSQGELLENQRIRSILSEMGYSITMMSTSEVKHEQKTN